MKIPIDKVVKGVKTPVVQDFLKENAAVIIPSAIGAVKLSGKGIGKAQEKLKQRKYEKTPFRKSKYIEYNTKVLKELDNKKRSELFSYKLEIEQFIRQLRDEENSALKVNKNLYSKRKKNWENILLQIEDKMKSQNFQEYLRIYNNPDYKSEYLKGFEKEIITFNKLLSDKNRDALVDFIKRVSDRDEDEIKVIFVQ